MGSKGSAAKTETSQTQSYEAHPAVRRAGVQAINMAKDAAGTPFNMPVAPVAGFNPFQQQSFDQTQAMQGQWLPYVNAAKQYYDQSAAPITGADVNNYYNPMAQNVFAQLANQQGQQWKDVTGRLTSAAGGVGAERIAVGQGQLANQQALAYGNVASNLWQQALGAAQQQKQMAANAAGGMLQTGAAGQNAALRDIATLGQAGLQQQQQSQAELNAPYQNRLAEIAYPFQTAQYLAGITGGVAPALGGTSTGTSTTTHTPAQPSGWSQAIGLGMQGLGMMMGMPTFPGMGMGGGGAGMGPIGMFSGSGNPYSAGGFNWFAEGGAVSGSPVWETSKGVVPGIKMQPGNYPSRTLNLAHHKMPAADASASSVGSLASKAMSQIGGLIGHDSGYEPDDHADGGAVFPKHFYDGGFVDFSTPLGSPGIPGMDFELPVSNTGNLYFDKAQPTPEPGTFAAGAAQSSAPASSGLTSLQLDEPKPFPAPSKAPHEYAREWLGLDSPAPQAKGDPNDYESPPRRWPALPAPEQPMALPAPEAAPALPIPMPQARPSEAGPSGSIIERTANAIRGNEGNVPYNQFHPQPDRKGNYAIGPYGIMDFNVPSWTKEALGRPMTVKEFMNDPEAQERTAKFKLAQYIKEHGPEGAAMKWFTGSPNPDPSRSDGYNTAAWYLKNFRERFGGDKGAPEVASAVTRRPAPDSDRMTLPQARQPYPDALERDWGQRMTRSPWMSLVKAGAVTASTPGPTGAAVAKGLGAFADHLTGERGIRQKEETINQRAQQLHQQAQHYLDQYEKMTPYQKASLEQRDDALAKTIYPGKGAVDGQTVDGYYQYNPSTRSYDFNPGAIITPRGSAAGKSPAMVQTAEWMVANGIAKTPQEAFEKLKTGVRDAVSRGRLLLDIEKALVNNEPQLSRQPDVLKQRAQEKLQEFLKQGVGTPAAAAAGPKPSLTPEQEKALTWLQANPNDPRAAAVRDKLRAEGIE